jgi:hypothetical protein
MLFGRRGLFKNYTIKRRKKKVNPEKRDNYPKIKKLRLKNYIKYKLMTRLGAKVYKIYLKGSYLSHSLKSMVVSR